ncbi:hypothetical protein SAMN04487891_111104 [Flagellimonas taeanensis]|uniref:Uncharacterized protein n=1 Tax=Flagellimonas taeanensis TaxID=1005926 RepID=A0A1M6W916_9FLAO|nr:hypothetical protein [Allomuricauda taeanensis]SFC45342.1 hypothetical protein SAMN04487891_111104 [Allomuricauda taeanensis]SHK90128.1 hypothetical protein SAMN05216293_2205 [Allomuricauda taeanensis]
MYFKNDLDHPKLSAMDAEGRFYFNVDRYFGNVPGYFQVLEEDWQTLEMDMNSDIPAFGNTTFLDFVVPENLHDFILQKSVQTQIESSYSEAKQDNVLPPPLSASLIKDLPYAYDLDNYTRFNSIEETLVEVVANAWVKTDSGKRVFQVRPENGVPDLNFLPLVFVDGLFIKDHERFMDYSAKKIKSVRFSREKFLVGSTYYQGVLAFETLLGDFKNDYTSPELQQMELSGPAPSKSYYVQKYDGPGPYANARIPDFRNQLLWLPNVDVQKERTLEFYTSDVPGRYAVVLKGFTANGKPVEIITHFRVF